MFKSKENKPATIDGAQASINIISKGTSIDGDISSLGDLRFEGSLHGTLNCKAKVVIGDSADIEGNVIAQDAVISGKVVGNVMINEVLFLKPTAKIMGDITAAKLVVEAGAEFIGTCKMKSEWAKEISKQNETQGRASSPEKQ